MGISEWFKSFYSRRERLLSRYRTGMLKAKKGDFAGAILEYTTTIEDDGVPSDVLGMALYNRALAYSAINEDGKALEDLNRVLGMRGLPENINVAAGQRRERLRRRES